MARIRNLKPDFFTSADIVALSCPARLLFQGLWCESDREGRFVWRPLTFKLRYLPTDDVDIEAICGELLARGLVVRYGDRFAYIPTFSKHQRPNPREAASELPDPADYASHPGVDETNARVSDALNLDVHAQGGKGGEGKEREGREGRGSDTDASLNGAAAPRPTRPGPVAIPRDAHLHLIEAWNVEARRTPEWTVVRTDLDDKPRQRINAALRSLPDIGAWEARFARAARSLHLTGRNGKGFVADFWWLLDHVAELDAGRYDERERTHLVAVESNGTPPPFVPPGAPGREDYETKMAAWQRQQAVAR